MCNHLIYNLFLSCQPFSPYYGRFQRLLNYEDNYTSRRIRIRMFISSKEKIQLLNRKNKGPN